MASKLKTNDDSNCAMRDKWKIKSRSLTSIPVSAGSATEVIWAKTEIPFPTRQPIGITGANPMKVRASECYIPFL